MPLLEIYQRSPEWFQARIGKITASVAAGCLGLDPYMGPISAWKAIMGLKKGSSNAFMDWGNKMEAPARAAYQVETGNLVEETGFWVHPELDWLGASPDGLIGKQGLLEVKCPGALPTCLPPHHAIQVQVQLFVTSRRWCDYFAWTPDGTVRWPISAEIGNVVEMLERFYRTYVLTNTPPPRQKATTAKQLLEELE